jgi:hypothetical protein
MATIRKRKDKWQVQVRRVGHRPFSKTFNVKKDASLLMTGNESRNLSVGSRVRWAADEGDQGTVTEKNWSGVTLKWDNRDEQSVLHNDMQMVFHVPTK